MDGVGGHRGHGGVPRGGGDPRADGLVGEHDDAPLEQAREDQHAVAPGRARDAAVEEDLLGAARDRRLHALLADQRALDGTAPAPERGAAQARGGDPQDEARQRHPERVNPVGQQKRRDGEAHAHGAAAPDRLGVRAALRVDAGHDLGREAGFGGGHGGADFLAVLGSHHRFEGCLFRAPPSTPGPRRNPAGSARLLHKDQSHQLCGANPCLASTGRSRGNRSQACLRLSTTSVRQFRGRSSSPALKSLGAIISRT